MTSARSDAYFVLEKALTDIDLGEIESARERMDEADDLLAEVADD